MSSELRPSLNVPNYNVEQQQSRLQFELWWIATSCVGESPLRCGQQSWYFFTLVFQVSPAPRNIDFFMNGGSLLIHDLATPPPCLLLTVVTILHMLLVHRLDNSTGRSQDWVYTRCYSFNCFHSSFGAPQGPPPHQSVDPFPIPFSRSLTKGYF